MREREREHLANDRCLKQNQGHFSHFNHTYFTMISIIESSTLFRSLYISNPQLCLELLDTSLERESRERERVINLYQEE